MNYFRRDYESIISCVVPSRTRWNHPLIMLYFWSHQHLFLPPLLSPSLWIPYPLWYNVAKNCNQNILKPRWGVYNIQIFRRMKFELEGQTWPQMSSYNIWCYRMRTFIIGSSFPRQPGGDPAPQPSLVHWRTHADKVKKVNIGDFLTHALVAIYKNSLIVWSLKFKF